MENITIIQELEKIDARAYQVKMTVERAEDVEVIEFEYNDTNGIFPLYNSLINTIRGIEDAHIELETCNPVFAREVNGSPNRHARLLEILIETKNVQGVTINAIKK